MKIVSIYIHEKRSVLITTHGHSGHASILFNDTAVEKLNFIMNKFLELRRVESSKLNELNYPYGNVTAINLTILKGGIKTNIVPPEMSVFIDMRLAIDLNWDELESMVSVILFMKVQNEQINLCDFAFVFIIYLIQFIDPSMGKRSRRCYS